jgi:hypothetical protein
VESYSLCKKNLLILELRVVILILKLEIVTNLQFGVGSFQLLIRILHKE